MYRLLATDIDDTILAPDGSLPEANHQALLDLHRRGIAVVMSSGRSTASLRKVAVGIIEPADDEYLISFNGSRVTTVLSGRVLMEHLLDQSVIRDVTAYTRRHGVLVFGYTDEGFLAELTAAGHADRAASYGADTQLPFRAVDSLADELPAGSAKLLIVGPHEELLGHQAALHEISAGRFDATFSKPVYLEVVPSGVSKGAALVHLAEYLGIPVSETVAVGDSLNDIEMIRTAGLGVAVANARQEAKEAADAVLTRTAADGAIAELAERYFPR